MRVINSGSVSKPVFLTKIQLPKFSSDFYPSSFIHRLEVIFTKKNQNKSAATQPFLQLKNRVGDLNLTLIFLVTDF